MKILSTILFFLGCFLSSMAQSYYMPHESEPHEGTWLQWPHQYEYGMAYRNELDTTWIEMTKALASSENVHIIAYNNAEKNRIISLLAAANIILSQVDFYEFPTNDVWVRDNGPIFVKDSSGQINIEDWGFNGWGGKFNFSKCNIIPKSIGNAMGVNVEDLNAIMVNEGGAVEMDGKGVLMACKSSIISQSPANSIRNLGMTQSQAETIFAQYLGVSKFIWLDGNVGDPNDVTDFHIDGFAKFVNADTLVTMTPNDLAYWGVSSLDISLLNNASNANYQKYTKVYLPLTKNNVITNNGKNLGYKGSYVNYYIANQVILVPNYHDPNDALANGIIQSIYPGKTVMGIDCRNLYQYGGMVHCVTQQQPASDISADIEHKEIKKNRVGQNFPNPIEQTSNIPLELVKEANIEFVIYNTLGINVFQGNYPQLSAGSHLLTIDATGLKNGIYSYVIKIDKENYRGKKLIILKK